MSLPTWGSSADTTSQYRFSSSRIEELRGKLQGETSVPMELVQQVVRAIEIDGVEVCERLDVQSFCLVVEILTKSPPFVAQERGLYLLMVMAIDQLAKSPSSHCAGVTTGQCQPLHCRPSVRDRKWRNCSGGTEGTAWDATADWVTEVLHRQQNARQS